MRAYWPKNAQIALRITKDQRRSQPLITITQGVPRRALRHRGMATAIKSIAVTTAPLLLPITPTELALQCSMRCMGTQARESRLTRKPLSSTLRAIKLATSSTQTALAPLIKELAATKAAMLMIPTREASQILAPSRFRTTLQLLGSREARPLHQTSKKQATQKWRNGGPPPPLTKAALPLPMAKLSPPNSSRTSLAC